MTTGRASGSARGAGEKRQFNSLAALNRALLQAPLYIKGAGRIVAGEGPVGAAIAFVGEQPGDQEDQACAPFVGPAGQLLDQALERAGIDRSACYVTNAVKQFKFLQRGKRRLHQRPKADEIAHYRSWLAAELGLVAPKVIVALGATALHALSDQRLSVTANRGPLPILGRSGYATIHPSAILRMTDRAGRQAALGAFVEDLRRIRRLSEADRADSRGL